MTCTDYQTTQQRIMNPRRRFISDRGHCLIAACFACAAFWTLIVTCTLYLSGCSSPPRRSDACHVDSPAMEHPVLVCPQWER